MKCYYSIIPSFHYSCLEYAELIEGTGKKDAKKRRKNQRPKGFVLSY
jgi:hypothetical protein